jgi:hypothetical protein
VLSIGAAQKSFRRNPPKTPKVAELVFNLFRRFSVASVIFGEKMLLLKNSIVQLCKKKNTNQPSQKYLAFLKYFI